MTDLAAAAFANATKTIDDLKHCGTRRITHAALRDLLADAAARAAQSERDRCVLALIARAAHWEGRELAWQHPDAQEQARILGDEVRQLARKLRKGN